MANWNPWHGCRKISAGCLNCYVYRIDAMHDRDASVVFRTRDFALPVRRGRDGAYRIKSGETVYACFSSDFFLEDADLWRPEAWAMIRERRDLTFFIVTKRIDRFFVGLPKDWGGGYENVIVCSTCENGERAAYRLPKLLDAPVRHKRVICEPLLEPLNLEPWLGEGIEEVIVGGESGPGARRCEYGWVLDIRRQCVEAGVAFVFRQTGACFVKDGRLYHIPRALQREQAERAGIDVPPRPLRTVGVRENEAV